MNISVKYKIVVLYEKIRTLPKNSYFMIFILYQKKIVLYRNIHTLLKILYFTKKFVHQMNRCLKNIQNFH